MNCFDCKICNGIACRGQYPGVGGCGNGENFIRNYNELKKITINFNFLCDDVTPNTKVTLFNKEFDMPIFMAPIAGLKVNYGVDMADNDYIREMLLACKEVNNLFFQGDGINQSLLNNKPLDIAKELNIGPVLTVKPWTKEGLDIRIDLFNKSNCFAMAMDIDGAGLGSFKNIENKVESKNVAALKDIKSRINKPFIVKGIITVDAALKAVEAGVDAIVVSNHGGRILCDAPSTIEVLKDIVDAVDKKCLVFIDGGFRTGADVFKALAIGADAILIGRPSTLSCIKGKKEGVINYYHKLQEELIDVMKFCGVDNISKITRKYVNI